MVFHRIPTQEPFFKLDQNQQVQGYLRAVKDHKEPKHQEIMKLVREFLEEIT